MKKIAQMLLLLVCHNAVFAGASPEFMLDSISFQLMAKQWITTQSALLTVNINAALTNSDLIKTRTDIMERLNQIAAGEWHLVQFDRSQDSSGLEKLYVQAQIRVPQTSLMSVYQKAKAVSKPGASYDVGGIEFKPSLEEVQQARLQLREKLYNQVQAELNRINKINSEQHYSLNNLVFTEGDEPPIGPLAGENREKMMAMAVASPVMKVSNELKMTAFVQVASNRELTATKQPQGH